MEEEIIFVPSKASIEKEEKLKRFFVDNNIELEVSYTEHEGTIIFEHSYDDHYAIEIFNSELISYFTNKSGKCEFFNFYSLEDVFAKLLEDLKN